MGVAKPDMGSLRSRWEGWRQLGLIEENREHYGKAKKLLNYDGDYDLDFELTVYKLPSRRTLTQLN